MSDDFYGSLSQALQDRWGHIINDKDLCLRRIKDLLSDEYSSEKTLICSLINNGIFSEILRLKPIERNDQKISYFINDATLKCNMSSIEARWSVETIVRILGCYSFNETFRKGSVNSGNTMSKKINLKKEPTNRHFVILVVGQRRGNGKTLVSRALLDFLTLKDVECVAIDTAYPSGELCKYYPKNTKIVNLSHFSSQLELNNFISSLESKVIIIDFSNDDVNKAIAELLRLGFFNRVKEFKMAVAIFHLLEPSVESLKAVKEMIPYTENGFYYIIKNFITNSTEFCWDIKSHDEVFRYLPVFEHELHIPYLNENVSLEVNKACVSFSCFIQNLFADGSHANFSTINREYLRKWFQKVTEEFDRSTILDLIDIVD